MKEGRVLKVHKSAVKIDKMLNVSDEFRYFGCSSLKTFIAFFTGLDPEIM